MDFQRFLIHRFEAKATFGSSTSQRGECRSFRLDHRQGRLQLAGSALLRHLPAAFNVGLLASSGASYGSARCPPDSCS